MLADDAPGAGQLVPLKEWWDGVKREGIKFGYFVKPSKSWLILKDPTRLDEAKRLFANSPINITVEGKRHLGAALGSEEFKQEYIDEKVQDWCKNIEMLAKIAESQPQAAYSAFIHGEQHKYTYFLRTICNISENLIPLDDAISNVFIPALLGQNITDQEREVLSLPIREGGMGIKFNSKRADISYQASSKITKPLINQIVKQSSDLPDATVEAAVKAKITSEIKAWETEENKEIKLRQPEDLQRTLQQFSEPGASSWLGALPLASHGFNLTKGEFQDAMGLRYNKPLKNLPKRCPCGHPYSVTHALDCKLGDFVNARHDNIRDMECSLLKSVVNDVECEPNLHPVINKQGYCKSANLKDDARLDIRARGFWRHGQNAYFDVRVSNADCASHRNKTLKQVLKTNEDEKKRQYKDMFFNYSKKQALKTNFKNRPRADIHFCL